MVDAESLEQSVATALELNQNEISRFVALKRLRKIIEEELAKDLAEDLRPAPALLLLDTAN